MNNLTTTTVMNRSVVDLVEDGRNEDPPKRELAKHYGKILEKKENKG